MKLKSVVKPSNGPTSDSQNPALFEAIRTGDADAFSRYYEHSFDRLVTLVERIVKNNEEARNIAQDTLLKLWLNHTQIDPKLSLNSFVSTMAWNAALDQLRKKRVHSRYHDEQLYLSDEEGLCTDENLVASETARHIAAVIRSMPLQRRRAFCMSRYRNMTYNEIAERMNISYSTVKEHIQMALKDLTKSAVTIIAILGAFEGL